MHPFGICGKTRLMDTANQRMPFPAPVIQTDAGLI
ncbi:hypothetical protein X752_02945 [Mesorhizobium sp. LNJC398B00]|nr:hypothetical protein X752_02945 [Mesorhizobium sp. LNJC398B00]